jgi:DNA-binding NarL/FixJ family response regulator
MKKITVILADDHTIIREGLRALLELDGGFEVVGEAADGRQTEELALALCPDVVVLDIAMPRLNGLEAARRILRQMTPPPKILMLSAHADDAYIDQVAALGVAGYLVKQTSAHILTRAIREVYAGKGFYSPAIARRLGGRPPALSGRSGRNRKEAVALTPRECEVLQLVAEGDANKEIAAELDISIKTVEKHRQNVMTKLGLHDTAGLTRYAIAAGVIESSVQCTIIP